MGTVAMVVTNACAPDPRVERQAAWLAEAGHDVVVHAFDRQEAHEPLEQRTGWQIERHHLGMHATGVSLATLRGLRAFLAAVAARLATTPPDLVVLHDADTLPLAKPLRADGVSVVFDMHDLRHTWVRLGAPRNPWRRIAAGVLARRTVRRLAHTDAVVTSSGRRREGGAPGLAQWLEGHGRKALVLENRPEQAGRPSGKGQNGWRVACLGRVRDTATATLLIEALRSIPQEERPTLRWAGDGVASDAAARLLRTGCEAHGIELELHGAFTHGLLDDLHEEVDVALALYEPGRGNIAHGALPVRMFEAASRGIPSIVNANTLMGEIAEEDGLGLAVAWGAPAALANALVMAKDMEVHPERAVLPTEQRTAWLALVEGLIEA